MAGAPLVDIDELLSLQPSPEAEREARQALSRVYSALSTADAVQAPPSGQGPVEEPEADRPGRSVPLTVLPSSSPPPWTADADGRVTPVRRAEFWRKLPRGRVACSLCYRNCQLDDGAAGWCGIRTNRGGRLQLAAHGVLSLATPHVVHYHYWRNHAKMLWLGGVACPSACSFCTSTTLALAPERLAWGYGERQVGWSGGWSNHRAMLHPSGAIKMARERGCSGVYFGANEPLLTFEWTLDTARLARRAGLFVNIDTNGFSDPAAIRQLGPFVDMVYLGLKGHADPDFYARRMRAEGAVPHVLAAAKAWKAAGVILGISDVIPPAHWVSDADAEDQQRRLYDWIAEKLGPLTPLELRMMIKPELPGQYGEWFEALTPPGSGDGGAIEAVERLERALWIARGSGLAYTYGHNERQVLCHHCAGVLVGKIGWIAFEKHVTADGRCEHCGGAVPIVVISDDEYEQVQREELAGSLKVGG